MMTGATAFFNDHTHELRVWVDGNRDPDEPDFAGSAPSEKEAEKLAFAEGYELRMPWKGTDDYSDWVMTEGVEVPETEGDGK